MSVCTQNWPPCMRSAQRAAPSLFLSKGEGKVLEEVGVFKLFFSAFFSPDFFRSSSFIQNPLGGPCFGTQTNKAVGSSARRCKQCRYKPKMLMDFIKMNVQKLNIPKLIHACERRYAESQLLLKGLKILCSSVFLYLCTG